MSELINKANKIRSSIKNNVKEMMENKEPENDWMGYLIYGILVVVGVFIIPNLSLNTIRVFDHLSIRIFSIIVIVLMCIKDPIIALLMSICLVLAIQRLQKLRAIRHNNNIKNLTNNQLNNLVSVNNVTDEESININNMNPNMNINPNSNNNMNVNQNMANPELRNNTINAVHIGDLLGDSGMNVVVNDKIIENFSSNEPNHNHTANELHNSLNNIVPANENQYNNVAENIINDENNYTVSSENSELLNNETLNNVSVNANLNINNQNNLNNVSNNGVNINFNNSNNSNNLNNLNNIPSEIANQNLLNNLPMNHNEELVNEDELVNNNNKEDVENALNQPAFRTLTENVLNTCSNNRDTHMASIQSQRVSNCDYDKQIKTFKDQHDIQGLDFPAGTPGTNLINTSAAFN